jgi:hypothetical protein
MRIKVKAQRHLVIGWRECDDGEWAFTICRRGFEAMLGERLETGSTTTVELTGTVIEREADV